MPSILPGYEYDIFISYRQNDNRSDKWVSNFVKALKEELEATLKNPVSIYFDENPHDGLLETHQVDASLAKKLKCLVFIPIVSQTYCDPTCFAWEHEFMPFIKMAKDDELGMNVTLSNGNVTSRVLPVKIHDLDTEDQNTLEAVLDGPLRSIDFIYGVAGVNRPLRAKEDDPSANLYKTFYRDQINKVANALKDIGVGIMRQSDSKIPAPVTASAPPSEELKPKSKSKILFAIIGVLMILVTAYFLYINQNKGDITNYEIEKSIAVLPFVNMSNDPDQLYFSDGTMDAILNHLTKIKGLKVISRTSVMQYRDTKKTIPEIAEELGVSYILEGGVQHYEDQVRIQAKLIEANTDKNVWSEKYDREFTDIFTIQSEVAQRIAKILETRIDPEVIEQIESQPTENLEAYNLYLEASFILREDYFEQNDFLKPYEMLERVIKMDPDFAMAYTRMAQYWIMMGSYIGSIEREKVIKEALPLLEKSIMIDDNDPATHELLASFYLFFLWDFKKVEKEINKVKELSPSSIINPEHLLALGRFEEALDESTKYISNDMNINYSWLNHGLALFFNGHYEESIKTYETALKMFPFDPNVMSEAGRGYIYLEEYTEAIKILEPHLKKINKRPARGLAMLAIAYYKTDQKLKSEEYLKELIQMSQESSAGSPAYWISLLLVQMEEIDAAFEWLDKAYQEHEVEMFWLKVEPPFEPLRSDPRWQEMLDKVGFPD
jgi:TolB-like protein